MSGTWPPAAPVTAPSAPPSYLFGEFFDDPDLQALVASFNQNVQTFADWFTQVGGQLPVYTSAPIAGPVLDWVGAGLYGLPRPSLASGQIVTVGPLNTWRLNTIPLNAFVSQGAVQNPTVSDDIYKRILTWFIYRGDGFQFTIPWLKRRIMRFLTGTNGAAPNIDNTYPVSVAFSGGEAITITITLTEAYGIPLSVAQIFQAAVLAGAISMPFQLTEVVVIVNDLGSTGLSNDAGLLQLVTSTGWPSTPMGLSAGAVWNNGGAVSVVPGQTPNPYAQPQYYGLISSAALLVLGGGNLPLTNPGVGSGELWNNNGLVSVA